MTTTVYSTGYSGRTPDDLLRVATELDAVVFDIRFSPLSRSPEWRKSSLAKVLGERYVHCKDLGNQAYKAGGHQIEIVNLEAGRAQIAAEARPVILLCVCADAATCHRTYVAKELAKSGFTVTEISLAEPRPQRLDIPQLSLF
jgi:uncharacterized protein (DUF488 family)